MRGPPGVRFPVVEPCPLECFGGGKTARGRPSWLLDRPDSPDRQGCGWKRCSENERAVRQRITRVTEVLGIPFLGAESLGCERALSTDAPVPPSTRDLLPRTGASF